MSVEFGGSQKPSTTTVTRNVAPMSQQEALLQAKNLAVAQQQAQYLQQAMQQQQAFDQSPLFAQLQGLQGKAAGGLEAMMGGQLLLPGQEAALQKYYQDAIINPAMSQMQQRAMQEAQRRGMTIADSPIGQPYLNEMANYRSQIGGQQAGSALQLSGQNRGMYQNVLDFGQALRQNAANNRLQLASAQPGSYNFGNQLAQNRIAQSPVTQQTRGGGKSPTYSIGASDVGNVLWGSGTNKDTGMGGLMGVFGLGGA